MTVKKVVAPPRVTDFRGRRGCQRRATMWVEEGREEPREGRTKAAPDAGPWEMDGRCLTQGGCS